ncbi:MAG: hypothetical protein LQ342_008209 [Letrouitia transgressa]|nr:MAG: hypothetical protein LQ342_008209 [Letrouitia transgressa]
MTWYQFLPWFLLPLVSAKPVDLITFDSSSLGTNLSLINPPSNYIVCNPDSWRHGYAASVAACNLAIDAFPSNRARQHFHKTPPEDLGHLPQKKYEGDCEVIVDLYRVVVDDYGSWANIQAIAKNMVRVCAWEGSGGRTKGGWTVTGEGKKISIKLGKLGWVDPQDPVNATTF